MEFSRKKMAFLSYRLTVLFLLFFGSKQSFSQGCPTDIFAIHYQGNAAIGLYNTVVTPQQDVIAYGNSLGIDRALGYDGWIARYSSRGTVLWAKKYMLPGYNNGEIHSIVMTSDSTFFATGRFSFLRKRFVDNVIEVVYTVTVLMELDKFGNLISMHAVNKFVTLYTTLNNILKVGADEYIVTGHVSGMNYERMLIFRMNRATGIRWSRLIGVENIRLGGMTARQAQNGNILLAGSAFEFAPNNAGFLRQGYYMMSVDSETGTQQWSRGYYFSNTLESSLFSAEGISSIQESASGEIFLYSSFSTGARVINPPYVDRGVVITTNATGNFLRATSYRNNTRGSKMIDGTVDGSGNHLLLMDNGEHTFLLKTTNNGSISWVKAYGNMNGNLVGASILEGLPPHTLFFRGRTAVALVGFLKTEDDGDMDCMETPVSMTMQDESATFSVGQIPATFTPSEQSLFEPFGGGIGRKAYNLDAEITCLRTCCDNIESDTSFVEFCNVSEYRLPDRTLVKESGIYYTNHKTAALCDSIAFYDIKLDKTPVVDLGPDDCLDGRDSIVLRTDSSYTAYNWMGVVSDKHFFTARDPGTYYVTVTNVCGSRTDSLEILDECEFDIFIPTGFTPNNDGLNDRFGYPSQNRNKLVRLTVFNRWGEKVFETTRPTEAWDGKLKNIPQPTGVYIYYVEAETLNKKKLVRSGIITLLR